MSISLPHLWHLFLHLLFIISYFLYPALRSPCPSIPPPFEPPAPLIFFSLPFFFLLFFFSPFPSFLSLLFPIFLFSFFISFVRTIMARRGPMEFPEARGQRQLPILPIGSSGPVYNLGLGVHVLLWSFLGEA